VEDERTLRVVQVEKTYSDRSLCAGSPPTPGRRFDAKSDREAARARFEEILQDPDASAFRKDVARAALKDLDERLDRKRPPR
jgi:hypothetical protein